MAQRKRILIKGGSGAGKSTLARTIADHLGLPYIELDALHHGPNWTPAPEGEFRRLVEATLDDGRGWVVEGNYDGKLGRAIVARADLIVWLDLPLATKLSRLVRRTASRWIRDEILWNGNRESLRTAFWGGDALFVWALRTHFSQRRRWPDEFRNEPVLRLRSAGEVSSWLEALMKEPRERGIESA